jgi:Flp pilus assembly protein protease CpaA
MDTIIFALVILWLAIISWFDLRKSEIPHSAWVVIPLVLAIFYQGVMGNWSLALFACVIAVISERHLLARYSQQNQFVCIVNWFPFLIPSLLWSFQRFPIVTLSICAFWVAWELGWWGGADATSAICLFLIFPTPSLMITFISVHLVVVLLLAVWSLLKEKRLRIHRLPGLPLLFLSVLSMVIFFPK